MKKSGASEGRAAATLKVTKYPKKNMENHADREFLETLVKAIVGNPDGVKVDRRVDEMGVLLTLQVSKEDMGVVVGKQGSTAKAIRTLLRIIGAKNNARVNLKIEEPEGSTRVPRETSDVEEVISGIKL